MTRMTDRGFVVIIWLTILALVSVVGLVSLFEFGVFDQVLTQADFGVDPNLSTTYSESTTQIQFEKLTKDDFVGNNQYRNSVVRFISDFGSGSGFIIAGNKVVTCAHCCILKDRKTYITSFMIELTCKTDQGEVSARYLCHLDKIDVVKDVAIGTIDDDDWVKSNTIPLELQSLDCFKDQTIVFYGYQPYDNFVTWQGRVLGLVDSKTYYANRACIKWKNLIKIEPMACPGNSGAPILCQGKVIGMINCITPLRSTSSCVQTKDILDVLNGN